MALKDELPLAHPMNYPPLLLIANNYNQTKRLFSWVIYSPVDVRVEPSTPCSQFLSDTMVGVPIKAIPATLLNLHRIVVLSGQDPNRV